MPETAKVNGREDAPSTAEEPGIGANKVVMHSVENSSGELEAVSPSPEGPQEPEASKEPHPEPSEEKSAHDVADIVANRPAEAIETEEEEGTSEESDSSDPEHGLEPRASVPVRAGPQGCALAMGFDWLAHGNSPVARRIDRLFLVCVRVQLL